MQRFYTIIVFVLLFAVLLFAVTCKKEYSYEGGSTAKYIFVGSPQQCTNAMVEGSFFKNVVTDSGNKVQLMIDVTSVGNYNISSNNADGIHFSASGKFTDTGRQTIFLYATGTPVATGDFKILIPGTTGCYFSITVTDQPGAKFTLSGEPNDCSNPVNQGSYTKGVAMTSANLITINIDVIEKGNYTISTDTVNGISFSASGTFTSTGTQQVILQATGTPQTPELSLFTLQGGASQCNFYIAVANAEPVATYVLQSGMQNGGLYCSPGSVQGMYSSGKTLAGSNTLTVNAFVTVLGNFTISTTELNGIKFSYTGTFSNLGAQDVILKGSGTPTNSGTFTFVPQIVGPAPLGGSTCGLDVVVQ